MNSFTVHSQDTAPTGSAERLAQTEKAFGFVPNLIGTFAESPATLEGYQALSGILDRSSLSATEKQVVLLATSRYNECHYCVAAHTVIAGLEQVPREVVDAIREDRPLGDSRLEALRQFTTDVVDKRGWVDADAVARFRRAGYGNQQVLEVILGVSLKTISNYTNHIAKTPVDDAFSAEVWRTPGQRKAG